MIKVDHDTIHGTINIKCITSVSKLSELLAIKRDLPKVTVTRWMRMKISFTLDYVGSKAVQWQ